MKVTKYLLPPMECVGIGPHMLLWTHCNFLTDRIFPTDLNGFLDIFPSTHFSQKDILVDLGMFTPFTKS